MLGLKFELFWVFYVMTFAMCFWILLLHIFVNFCTLRAKQLILCWYQKNLNVQYLVEKTCFYIVIYLPYEPSWYFYTEYSELSELHLSICFNFEIPTSFKLYGPKDVNLFAPFCTRERSRFYNTFDAKYFLVNVTEGSL